MGLFLSWNELFTSSVLPGTFRTTGFLSGNPSQSTCSLPISCMNKSSFFSTTYGVEVIGQRRDQFKHCNSSLSLPSFPSSCHLFSSSSDPPFKILLASLLKPLQPLAPGYSVSSVWLRSRPPYTQQQPSSQP